jgi:hypothetical protein
VTRHAGDSPRCPRRQRSARCGQVPSAGGTQHWRVSGTCSRWRQGGSQAGRWAGRSTRIEGLLRDSDTCSVGAVCQFEGLGQLS